MKINSEKGTELNSKQQQKAQLSIYLLFTANFFTTVTMGEKYFICVQPEPLLFFFSTCVLSLYALADMYAYQWHQNDSFSSQASVYYY